MPLIVSLFAAAVLAGEAPATAPATPQGPAAASPTAAVKPAKPKKVCVEQPQMGTLFSRRICATQEEWDRRAERDAAEMSRGQNSVPDAR